VDDRTGELFEGVPDGFIGGNGCDFDVFADRCDERGFDLDTDVDIRWFEADGGLDRFGKCRFAFGEERDKEVSLEGG